MKLLEELRRRNVLRASIAYVITAWVVVESASLLLEIFAAPAWVAQTIVIMLVAGFPVAMVFAWMFEITPDGLKPDREVDPATAAGTGRYIVLLSVVMTMVAAGLFVTDRFLIDRSTRPARADGPPVIAVLPFEIIGTGGGIDLSDGLHHDLLTRMSKLRAFAVISRTAIRPRTCGKSAANSVQPISSRAVCRYRATRCASTHSSSMPTLTNTSGPRPTIVI